MISSAYRALLAESSTAQGQQEKQKVEETVNQKTQKKSPALLQYERISSAVSGFQIGINQTQQWQHHHIPPHQILLPHSGGEPYHQSPHLSQQQQHDSKVHQMQQSKLQQRKKHHEEKLAQVEHTPHRQQHHGELRQAHSNKDLSQQPSHNQKPNPRHHQQNQQPTAEKFTSLEGTTAKQRRQMRRREQQNEVSDIGAHQQDMQKSLQYHLQQFQQQQQQFGRTQQYQDFSELPLDYRRQQQFDRTQQYHDFSELSQDYRRQQQFGRPQQHQDFSELPLDYRRQQQFDRTQQYQDFSELPLDYLRQQQFDRTQQYHDLVELPLDHTRQQQQHTTALKTENRRQKQQKKGTEQQQATALKTANRRQKQQKTGTEQQEKTAFKTDNRKQKQQKTGTEQQEKTAFKTDNRKQKQQKTGTEQQQTTALKSDNRRQNTENGREQQTEHRQQRRKKTPILQSEGAKHQQSTGDHHPESSNKTSAQSCTNSKSSSVLKHHLSAQMNAEADFKNVIEHQQSTGHAEVMLGKTKRRRKKKNCQSSMMESDDRSLVSAFDNVSLNASNVILDEYNSDLNAQIGPHGWDMATQNTPCSFRLLWAGSKANFGVRKGKVFFEAKIIKNLPSKCITGSWEPHAARIGWSDESSLLALGEEPISFGFENSRKFYVNNIHRCYGEGFNVDDVIGALLDLDSKPATISFMKNGTSLGIAESFPPNCVGETRQVVMYPHIFLKNCRVLINFGQQHSWFPPPQGFNYIGHLPSTDKVASLESPKSYHHCEVIMIVGLPCAGKTTWAKKQQKQNPEKRYNILGTDLLIERMGFPELVLYRDRFDKLYDSAEKCFKFLLKMASTKYRNYILDQTNVFNTARKKKMAKFSEFCRIAAVIQPSNQELERRSKERAEEQPVPDWVVQEMKSNFSLPTTDFIFDEVNFIELGKNETQNLVTWYNSGDAYPLASLSVLDIVKSVF